MNLTERAEIRKETFYKLTNSADVPTVPSEGGRNLMQRTDKPFVMGCGITNTTWDDDKKWAYLDLTDPNNNLAKASEILPQGQFWNFKPIKGMTYTQSILIDTDATFNPNGQAQNSWFTSQGHNQKRGYFEQLSETTYRFWSTCTWQLENIALRAFDWYGLHNVLDFRNSGTYLAFYKPKLTTGNLPSDWSPAPEDLGWTMDTLVPTQSNRYLWKFEYIYYSDGSVENTQPVNISIAGVNGQTSHVHFAFADNATGGGFSLTTPKAYMGWYADFNEAASTDPTKYRWGKWKGDQGLPGKPGADGKTSYFHMAYADSADGRTGFSFKESGQQYQGYYTDFTQTSSTDPTKYTWMDRRAGVEVGSKNLLRKTAINAENLKLFGKSNTTVSVVEKDGHQVYKLVVSGSSNAGAYFNGNSDYYNLVKDRSYTFSFWVLTNKDKTYSSGSLGHIQAVNNNSDKVGNDNLHQHTTPVYSTNTIKANTWTKVWCTFKATSNSYFKPYFWYLTAGDEIYIYDMMLNEGTIPLSHSLAPEDSQEQIDSKADSALTQEQLNALEAKRLQMEVELKAKATLEQVSELETFINNLKKEDLDGRQKIIEITKAIEERVKDIEPIMEYSQKLKFMDTYITQGNGGMIIGANDSTTKVVVTPDRISFQSGGSEVAYISQRMLHIDNGVFTMSLQLGHYITRAHPRNEYVNATYFVK